MTLYQVSTNGRKILVSFLIFAIVVVVGDAVIKKLFSNNLNPFAPVVSRWEDLPLNAFDTLKLPEIKAISINSSVAPRFDLKGPLPDNLPDTAKVYQVARPKEKLGDAEKAISVANALGFSADSANRDTPNLLVWENDRRTRKLEHNLVDRTWKFATINYFQDSNAIQPKTTNKDNNYPSTALALFNGLLIGGQGFTGQIAQIDLVKREPDRFKPITFTQKPEYAVANVYRKFEMSIPKTGYTTTADGVPLEKYSATVYTSNPYVGSVYMVVADNSKDPKTELFEFNYTNFEYSDLFSYYRILTAAQAWQNVQTGQGILTSLIPESASRYDPVSALGVRRFTADAPKAELAYYEPEQWTGYIYPIFIFRGTAELDNGQLASFVIYTSALR